jgi:Zn-dependent M32 family carboxypeptidase
MSILEKKLLELQTRMHEIMNLQKTNALLYWDQATNMPVDGGYNGAKHWQQFLESSTKSKQILQSANFWTILNPW